MAWKDYETLDVTPENSTEEELDRLKEKYGVHDKKESTNFAPCRGFDCSSYKVEKFANGRHSFCNKKNMSLDFRNCEGCENLNNCSMCIHKDNCTFKS